MVLKVSISLPDTTVITLEASEPQVFREVVGMALKELPTDLMRIHTGVKTLYPVEEGSKNVAPVYPDTGANGPVYPDASGQESVGTGSEESFARYCGAQSPVGDMRRIVVAAEGAKRLLGMESVSERELRYLFDLAMWRQPGDFLQSLRNAARSKFRWLERVPGATGYYTVTETGRDKVIGPGSR